MYISWGTGGDRKQISYSQLAVCESCRTRSPHSYWMVYRYFHFYHVFGVVTKREYFVTCEQCQATQQLARHEVPPEHLDIDPIPYSHRYGLFIGMGLFVAILSIAGVSEEMKKREKNQQAAQVAAAQLAAAQQANLQPPVAPANAAPAGPEVAASPAQLPQANDPQRPLNAAPPAGKPERDRLAEARRRAIGAAAAKQPAFVAPDFDSGKVQPFGLETQTLGGANSGELVRDAAPAGGVLVGFEVGLGRFGNNDVIGSLRAIYRVGDQESLGRQFGGTLSRVMTIKAEPGYAVGAIAVKAGLIADGLAAYFMRIDGDRLDRHDVVTSDWVGGNGGDWPQVLGGDGRPARGLVAKVARGRCTGVGLRFEDTPAAESKVSGTSIHPLLLSDPLPAGFQVTKTQDSTRNGQRAPTRITISGTPGSATAMITIDHRNLRGLENRRTAAKGYINGSGSAISGAGMQVLEQNVPDLDGETFERSLAADISAAGDNGKKLYIHQEIFFADKGFNVMVAGEDSASMAKLVQWSKTIKPNPDAPIEPEPKKPSKKKVKKPASAEPEA